MSTDGTSICFHLICGTVFRAHDSLGAVRARGVSLANILLMMQQHTSCEAGLMVCYVVNCSLAFTNRVQRVFPLELVKKYTMKKSQVVRLLTMLHVELVQQESSFAPFDAIRHSKEAQAGTEISLKQSKPYLLLYFTTTKPLKEY